VRLYGIYTILEAADIREGSAQRDDRPPHSHLQLAHGMGVTGVCAGDHHAAVLEAQGDGAALPGSFCGEQLDGRRFRLEVGQPYDRRAQNGMHTYSSVW